MNTFQRSESGVGYDNQLGQYYTITYIWEYVIDDLKKTKYRDVKSGITGGSSAEEAIKGLPTRYKVYPINIIWSDRKYLPKGTSKKNAESIVRKMDNSFKYTLESDKKWQKRIVKNDKSLGTEVYRVEYINGITQLSDIWEESFTQSCLSVLGKNHNFDLGNYEIVGEWGVHLAEFNDWYVDNIKGRFIATTGYGKGYIAWLFVYLTNKAKNLPIKVLYANSIPNTKQLAEAHDEKYDMGSHKRIIVCSNNKPVKTSYSTIESYEWSDGKLESIIKNSLKYKDNITFYVNRHSAGDFNNLINTLIDESGYDLEIPVVLDEIQDFTGFTSMKHVGAISNPIKNSFQLGITATEERRDDSDTRDSVAKNDDYELFGDIIREVTVLEAISIGRHSPVDFLSLVISDNDELSEVVFENKPVVLKLGRKKDIVIRGRLMRTLSAVSYSIKNFNRKKIGVVASLSTDAHDLIDCLELMKSEGQIPKKYKIVNSLRKFKDDAISTINNSEYVIFVGTPWMCTGLDLPSADCGIATYDFGKTRVFRQWVGRFTRPFEYKNGTEKRALIVIPLDANEKKIPNSMLVKEDMENDRNTHSNSKPAEKRVKTTFGSKIKKVVTHTLVKGTQIDAETEFFWNEVEKAINNNELSSIEITKIKKDFILDYSSKYKNLSELIKCDYNLYLNLRSIEDEMGFGIYNNFADYRALPNQKEKFKKYILSKHKTQPEKHTFQLYRTKNSEFVYYEK